MRHASLWSQCNCFKSQSVQLMHMRRASFFWAGSDDHHHELGALIGLQMWRAALSTSVYFSGAIHCAH